METLQSFLPGDSLDVVSDVEMLYIVAAAFMPSILGLLLALIAHWLPDEGFVVSQHPDGRQRKDHGTSDDQPDWRRAA